jgi:vacuolar-type H+-ATPase subunit I/STV1
LEKNIVFKAVLLFSVLVIILAACAKPPTAEIEAAEAAVTRAENDPDAAAYAESSLTRARNALSRARTEVNAKRYDSAKSYAAEAVSAAEKAINDGRAGASRSREEANTLLAQVKQLLAETNAALENAKKVPRVQLDFPALTNGIDSARNDISQAEAANNANRPRESLEKSRSARSTLGDIQNRINEGVRGTNRKK